ncbi:MAG TPA: 50S ribosomal protein L22 [Chlorobium sp.]|uniref:Large ribosomal subunit protein uL22 n=1 Tax=Chlorobium phaeovibrioides (strain DSM 265 / 1930) TaxID=290318 RepID=RL22_CHLPM|nr:RecName: Full=Large ribosomal subunit protein uL22; AltName: Full=50S ribosomal protein L22 [Chlorobium phaeovibrioides DSM 265]HCD36575.1 50S ribosomal protein L22 [Chlorobium sp.]
MQAKAILRHTPTSPRKMRLVAGLVRGKAVDQAKAILLNSTKAASRNALQTLKSAVANYAQLNPDERVGDQELFVKSVFVDEGATLKRMLPAPMGRAYRVRKRSNHLTIVVDRVKNPETK